MADPLKDWSYTGTYLCRDCDQTFAVLSPEGYDPQFCPFCGGRGLGNYADTDD